MSRYDFLDGGLVVESELGICSQGGDVNKLVGSVEGLFICQNMATLTGRAGKERVRISLPTSVTTERLTKCEHAVQESAFTGEPISLDRRSAITGGIS